MTNQGQSIKSLIIKNGIGSGGSIEVNQKQSWEDRFNNKFPNGLVNNGYNYNDDSWENDVTLKVKDFISQEIQTAKEERTKEILEMIEVLPVETYEQIEKLIKNLK